MLKAQVLQMQGVPIRHIHILQVEILSLFDFQPLKGSRSQTMS